jgi:hypothetical protein
MMTREQFIEGYVARSGIAEHRTADGYSMCGRETFALPCQCDEEGCEGWAMVRAEGVRWHLYQNTEAQIEDPTRIETPEEGAALALSFMATILPQTEKGS